MVGSRGLRASMCRGERHGSRGGVGGPARMSLGSAPGDAAMARLLRRSSAARLASAHAALDTELGSLPVHATFTSVAMQASASPMRRLLTAWRSARLASAPEAAKDAAGQPLGAHDLMLKRLAHEYAERKLLCSKLEDLKSRKRVRYSPPVDHLPAARPCLDPVILRG